MIRQGDFPAGRSVTSSQLQFNMVKKDGLDDLLPSVIESDGQDKPLEIPI